MRNNTKVKIIDLEYLDKDSGEAVVTFMIDDATYQAYGFPVYFNIGELYEVELDYIEGIEIPWDIMFNENHEGLKALIKKPNSTWSYSAYGQISSVNPVIVDCGVAEFDLGCFSRDERLIGEYIFFDISRLDISNILPT